MLEFRLSTFDETKNELKTYEGGKDRIVEFFRLLALDPLLPEDQPDVFLEEIVEGVVVESPTPIQFLYPLINCYEQNRIKLINLISEIERKYYGK